MAFKRVHSDEEIDVLAERFRVLWTVGNPLRPWFRQHRDLILELVHGQWSWTAIARALTKAEITYSNKKEWTADWLLADFWRAQKPLKGYARRTPKDSMSTCETTDSVMPSAKISPEEPRKIPPEISPPLKPALVIRPVEPPELGSKRHALIPDVGSRPKFKAFSLKSQEPPREPSPEEREEREAIRVRMFGKR